MRRSNPIPLLPKQTQAEKAEQARLDSVDEAAHANDMAMRHASQHVGSGNVIPHNWMGNGNLLIQSNPATDNLFHLLQQPFQQGQQMQQSFPQGQQMLPSFQPEQQMQQPFQQDEQMQQPFQQQQQAFQQGEQMQQNLQQSGIMGTTLPQDALPLGDWGRIGQPQQQQQQSVDLSRNLGMFSFDSPSESYKACASTSTVTADTFKSRRMTWSSPCRP